MSAAVAFQPHVTILPPGPERPELTSEFFDRRSSTVGRKQPISAEYSGAGEFASPKIAFEDYGRMHSFDHKLESCRRLATPQWALRPDLLRVVVVHFVERRAGFKKPLPGTEKERLEQASKTLAERCGSNESVLRNLCSHFVELKKANAEPTALAALKIQIENLDTRLRIDRDIAGIVIRAAHLYYGAGLDSVGVATELGLKPPHVRALIWKLNWVWDKLNGKAKPRGRAYISKKKIHGPRMRINVLGDWTPPAKEKPAQRIQRIRTSEPPKAAYIRIRKIDVAIAAQMRDAGATYEEIGQFFGAHQTSIHGALKKAKMWKRPAPRFKIDVDLLTRLFHEGKSTTEMGNALGIPIEMVRYYMRRLGLVRLRPQVDIEIAARMLAAGATYADIAKTLRLPNETAVARALKRNGTWKPHRNISVDLELLARLFNEGKTQIEIQNILGISRCIVRLRLERLGLWRGRGRCRRRSKVDREITAKMFADGQSYRQMANFFGVTSPAIAYALKKQGCWHPRAVTHK